MCGDESLIEFKAALAPGVLSADTVNNTRGFAGYIFQQETLNYSVRHRVYDPVLGRWLQRDPAGYVDGLSLYLYAGASPYASIDPYGLWDWDGDWIEVGLGGVGGFFSSMWDNTAGGMWAGAQSAANFSADVYYAGYSAWNGDYRCRKSFRFCK